MPELPEVEVVRLGLVPALEGAVLRDVWVRDLRGLRRHPGSGDDFVTTLRGREVSAVARRGKFLWFRWAAESELALIAHLGMSGQLLLREPSAPVHRHERVGFGVEHPLHGDLVLSFVDQRTFGSLAVDELRAATDALGVPSGLGSPDSLIPSQIAHISRDVLDPALDEDRVVARIRRSGSAIKKLVLDQGVVSGVGNIYADEGLWLSGIHPLMPGSELTDAEIRGLLQNFRTVMLKALSEGGTSFDAQYVNVNGESGYFSRSLQAYGRGGEPCPRCGTLMRRIPFAGRSATFCPRCQRKR